jgi:molybdate transport system substrate-binding protein
MPPIRPLILALALAILPAAAQITAAVAANVRYAMEELKSDFKKASGIEVKTVYGASGSLTAQIRNGAPFDVFVSADMAFPDSLFAWGLAAEKPKPYAYGRLVLWTTRDLDLGKGLAVLAEPAQARIALADPRLAPYGREAVKAMRRAGVYERAQSRLVFAEDVSQVNQYVLTGAADVGFTAKASVLAPESEGKGRWIEVDGAAYDSIAQGAVLCKRSRETHPADASRFLAYLYSAPARAILARYGYGLP